MRLVFAAAAVLLALSPAFGQSGITLGRPGYGGNGCPGGSAAVALSADGKSLTLRFDSYKVAAGGGTGRSFDRKTCNLSIPVRVPSGKSVSVIAVDYRGSNRLPRSASAVFTVEHFIAGGRGKVFKRTFTGPDQASFAISDTLTAKSWSACGTDVILRTNSSLRVTTSGNATASASVGSQSVRSAIVYRLQWRDC